MRFRSFLMVVVVGMVGAGCSRSDPAVPVAQQEATTVAVPEVTVSDTSILVTTVPVGTTLPVTVPPPTTIT